MFKVGQEVHSSDYSMNGVILEIAYSKARVQMSNGTIKVISLSLLSPILKKRCKK